jgi:hypothetical protein
MKLIRSVKMFLHDACSDVWTGKHFSDEFQTVSGLEQGDDLQLLHIGFAWGYAMKWDQANHEWSKLNGTYQILVYAYDISLLVKTCIL